MKLRQRIKIGLGGTAVFGGLPHGALTWENGVGLTWGNGVVLTWE